MDRFRELLGAADDLLGEIDRMLGRPLDAEVGHAVRGRVGQIDDVIDPQIITWMSSRSEGL